MSVIFRHDGDALDFTPESDVAAGEVVVLGSLVTVALTPIEAGKLGSVKRRGVFRFPMPAADTLEAYESAYWDDADEEVNADDANPFAGTVLETGGDSDGGFWADVLLQDAPSPYQVPS